MDLLPFERADMRINAKIVFKNFKINFAMHFFTQPEGFIFQECQHSVKLFFFLKVA